MLKTHLIGIIKIQKNSVWHQHYSYYRKINKKQATAAATTKSITTKCKIAEHNSSTKLPKIKKNCRCLRKRRKFHIRKIQNLWFGSNVYLENYNNNK